MRHSSYTTTADTYTHVMPAHSAEAVRTVAAPFERPSRLLFPPPPEPQTRRERLVVDQQRLATWPPAPWRPGNPVNTNDDDVTG
jgi:hypothetical protein